MDQKVSTPDPAYQNRAAFADRYYSEDLQNQREWYSSRANALKKRGEVIAFVVILLGAATAFIQALPDGRLEKHCLCRLRFPHRYFEGWKKIVRYDETWRAYRVASERMKHERRLYLNAAGHYQELDEEAAKKLFVTAVEDIISEEQQIFWSSRELKPAQAPSAGATN